MSGRRLAHFVHVRDERGRVRVFGPNDAVPAWAAAKITSRVAWVEDPAEEPDQVSEPPPASQDSTPEPASEAPAAPSAPAEAPVLQPPARTGTGSSRAAWSTYAQKLDVSVTEDMNREQIIAAVDAAGHPVD